MMNAKKSLLIAMKDLATYDPYFLVAFQEIYEMSSAELDKLMASLQSDDETLRLMATAHDTFKHGSPNAIESARERLRNLFRRNIKKAKSN